jgi:hypothetical protein
MKKLIVIAALAGFVIFALSAQAHSPGPQRGRRTDRQVQARQTDNPHMMCRGGWSDDHGRHREMKQDQGCPHWYGWFMPWHGSRCNYRNRRGHRRRSHHGPRRGHRGW